MKPHEDSESGIAVIANNYREAKRMGYSWWGSEHGHECDYIEQRVKLVKNANVEGLKEGPIDDFIEGLKRGLYGYVLEECPICKSEMVEIYYDDEQDRIGCDSCLYPEDDN